MYKDPKIFHHQPPPPSLGVEMVARTHMCIKLLKVYAGCRLPGCGDARCPLSLLTLDPVTIVARRCRLDISRRRGKPEKSVKIPHAIRIPLLRHCAALIHCVTGSAFGSGAAHWFIIRTPCPQRFLSRSRQDCSDDS